MIFDNFSGEPLLSTVELSKYFFTTKKYGAVSFSNLFVFDVIQLLSRVLVLDLIFGHAIIEGDDVSVDPLRISLDSDLFSCFVHSTSSNTISRHVSFV